MTLDMQAVIFLQSFTPFNYTVLLGQSLSMTVSLNAYSRFATLTILSSRCNANINAVTLPVCLACDHLTFWP